jgi:hypothetical protein
MKQEYLLQDFLSMINQTVEINMRPDFNDRDMKWYASVPYGWLRDGIMNRGFTGNGPTPNDALANLAIKMAGKQLVITKSGVEALCNVPENLVAF